MEIKDISQLDLNGTYSYADYLLWKFTERVELFKGKILKMSPAPNRKHQKISRNVNRILDKLFYKQACEVYYAPFDVRLPKKSKEDKDIYNVVQPDLCVICDPTKLDEKGCIGAPDLVVEILSPGNSKKEVDYKFDLYEEAGVREYWIIDPDRESLVINILKNGKYTIKKPIVDNEVFSSIFPNLKTHTDDIFEI